MSLNRLTCGLAVFVVAALMTAPVAGAADDQQQRVRVGGEIKEPKKIKDVKPVYPEEAQRAGIQGIVILEIVIGTDGTVHEAKILRPAPPLDKAALDAVMQWRYTPTLLNGEPVEVIMTVTVTFTLGHSTPRAGQAANGRTLSGPGGETRVALGAR